MSPGRASLPARPAALPVRLLLLLALALPACTETAAPKRPTRATAPTGTESDRLPGGSDPQARVDSGKAYETHGWYNLAQRQYLESIRLAPDRPAGYEALLAYLGRIQAWPAAWLVVRRARQRSVILDRALLAALDERSGWPVSTGDPAAPPAEIGREADSLVPALAGIPVDAPTPRPDLRERIRKSDEAMDRLIQLGALVVPRLRLALAAERDDPYLRASLCNVLLRTELARRSAGEPPDPVLVAEAVAGLRTLDRGELWFPLWSAATVLARLGDPAGLPVLEQVLAIDGAHLSGIFQSPRMDWDLLLVFAIGPMGEAANGVLESSLRGTDPVRRGNALRALTVLFHDRLLPTVRESAREDWAPEYRLMVALFHLQYLHEATLEELMKLLTHGMSTEPQRMAAVSALGELGTPEAHAALEGLAKDGTSVVHRHAQMVLADLDAGRLAPPEPEGSQMTAEQTDQALAEMIGEHGVGLARLAGAFQKSCDRSHLPALYALRARILWRVTSNALDDLKAANEVIRGVVRGR